MNMKKLNYLLVLILPFLLVACGPPLIFGIPQEQWDQLNQQQRNQVIQGYNQKQKVEAQTAPFVAAIDALANKPANTTPPYYDPIDQDPFFQKYRQRWIN